MVLSPACSCGDEGPSYRDSATGSGGADGAGGNEVTAHATGGSGAGGEGGSPGDHGARGVAVGDVVSAGQVVESPRYRMVFTLGQPTQNQGKTTSPSFRMQGGLVGANGSLP
ncbi:hypothetical protein [Sorangium cellulosum]|nr:hypothetical protein [Sorangium cellulosum]